MQYKYIPNSIKIIDNISYDDFLKLQIKYRESLEALIKKYVSFEEVDKIIENLNFSIPLIQDQEYNFYHKFSTLGSKYVFISIDT